MNTHKFTINFFTLALVLCQACAVQQNISTEKVTAYTNTNIIDGTGNEPIENGTLIVKDGKIFSVGASKEITIPKGASIVNLSGKTIIPGLVNAHGHVGDAKGLKNRQYSRENALEQLKLYAKYGITTVASLGLDKPEAQQIRDEQNTPNLARARYYYAGEIVVGQTTDTILQIVDRNLAMDADYIKIRIDVNHAGKEDRMPVPVYYKAIEKAHEHNKLAVAHLYYLQDAKNALNSGLDFIVHSIRDQEVDKELIELIKEKDVCYCATMAREVSVFAYAEKPDFFEDPFFLKEADTTIIQELLNPWRMAATRKLASTQIAKDALETAKANLKILYENDVRIAMGTDSGPPARFQGYFEHLELELMQEAGMTPMDILTSATGEAAKCLGLTDVGILKKGNWADFIVLGKNPLENILHSRTIETVFIAGNKVE